MAARLSCFWTRAGWSVLVVNAPSGFGLQYRDQVNGKPQCHAHPTQSHGVNVMRLVDPELIQLAAYEAQRARDQQQQQQQQQQQAKPPPPQQQQLQAQAQQQQQPAQAQHNAATANAEMYDTNDIFAAANPSGDGGANGGLGSPQRRQRPHTPPGFSSPRSSDTGGASLPSPVPVPVPVPSPSDAVVSPAGFQPPGVFIPDGPGDPSAHSPYNQMQTPLPDPSAAQPLAAASIFWVAAADESGTPLTRGSPLVPTEDPPVAATAVTSMVQHVHSCQQVGLAVLTAGAQPAVLAVYAPYAVGVIDLGPDAAGGFGGLGARQVHVSFEPAVYLVDLAGAVTAAAVAAGAGHGGDPVAAATGEAAAALLRTLRGILEDPGICKVVHGVDQVGAALLLASAAVVLHDGLNRPGPNERAPSVFQVLFQVVHHIVHVQ